MSEIALIMPGKISPVLASMVEAGCNIQECDIISNPHNLPELKNKKIAFAVELNNQGYNIGMLEILSALYDRGEDSLKGSNAIILIHSGSELFTKSAAQDIIFLANRLGCRFLGHPLVEATVDLENFSTWQKSLDMSLHDICMKQSKILFERLLKDNPVPIKEPSIVALHSSSRTTSNTLELWHMVSENLHCSSITELHVENGEVLDCNGCAYKTCIHYSKQNSCFYGGFMVKNILPAVQKADAVVWICPNYNDAVSANLTAVINRLTALYRLAAFYNKTMFSIIVSGNSGSDSIAKQLIGALNINKGFRLPPYFSIMAVANDMGEIMKVKNIKEKAASFASHMLDEIKS